MCLVRSMRALVFAAVTLAAVSTRGDMPLPPPARVTATSPNGAIRAVSEPRVGTRVEDVRRRTVLWRVPSWHRSIFVADDGRHLVTGYDGLNLIPTDYSADLALITFWREGRQIGEVTVAELFPDRAVLQRTVSHHAWGTIDGIDARGRLKVQRIDGKTLYFDVATGKKT